MIKRYTEWPIPELGSLAVQAVIEQGRREGYLGVDCEFGPAGPTIIGVASLERSAAWWWEPGLGHMVLDSTGTKFPAHAGIGADKPIFEKALNRISPVDQWIDTMLAHWIVNPDLASVPKTLINNSGDSDSGVVLGLMNLWACTSLLHDLPNWKNCYSPFSWETGKVTNPIAAAQCCAERRVCPFHTPLEYCATDAFAGLINYYSLRDEMERLKIPWSYYEFRARVTEYCHKVQEKGVNVNVTACDELERVMVSKKDELFPSILSYDGKPLKNGTPRILKKPKRIWQGPFNPNSPQAVIAWFDSHNIQLRDRMGKPSKGKDIVQKTLERELKHIGLGLDSTGGILDGEDFFEGELTPELDLLSKLYQKALAGKGLDSWFSKKYISNGKLHARFNSCGTCMGRLSSSKPNLQNVPKNGFGAEVRRVVEASPGYKFVNADFSSGETFVCLWFARSNKSGEGLFEKLCEYDPETFERAGKLRKLSGRDVAKSVSHASSYAEGLILLTGQELSRDNRISERSKKALLVFDGREQPLWQYRGKYVCFTGANLAERLYGNRTCENRAKALKLQELYFTLLPELRDVYQREACLEAELTHEVRLPGGHRLPLNGRSDEDDIKQALACKGQGGLAIYAQEGMTRYGERNNIMNFQVHDEYAFEIPLDWTDEQALDFIQLMVKPSEILPGFTCPAKVSVGLNWKDKVKIGTVKHSEAPNPATRALRELDGSII